MALFLRNATFIDWKTFEFKNVNIKVEEGLNEGIVFIDSIPKNIKSFDCSGKYVTKSFGCGHHHVYSALSVGMPSSKRKIDNFNDILENIWWKLDKCLDEDMIRASAMVTAIACAKNGVTFCIDHHSSPNSPMNSLDVISECFKKVGVSSLLCIELSDRDGKQSADKGIEETNRFLSLGNQGLVGLHASFTVSDALLKRAICLVDKYHSGMHVHVAEDPIDQKVSKEKYGKSVIERFRDSGVLFFDKTILAHCLHLNEKEWRILSDYNCFIAENIESNLNNNVGNFKNKGSEEKVMLGTDGMHSDMLKAAKAVYFYGKNIENKSMLDIYSRFRNIHSYLNKNFFEGDSDNNLVILDYKPYTPIGTENFLGHFFYNIESRHIHSVISAGRFIVKDRKIVNVDEDSVLKYSIENADRLWRKLESV